MPSTLLTKFESKYMPEPNSGCWLWTDYLDEDGYGQFRTELTQVRAHRFAYEELRGQIPAGLTIDHLCRTRSCVNPDHMEPVTNKVNVLRGNTLAAKNKAKTHCSHGHSLSDAWIDKRGSRFCRECSRGRARQQWRKLCLQRS